MLRLFLYYMMILFTLSSYDSQAAKGKGEDCDPKKVDLTHNICACDPATHDWVVDECLVKCQGKQVRTGKLCMDPCKKGEISVNGKCIIACTPEEILTVNGCEPKPKTATTNRCGNTQELIGGTCVDKCGNNYERVGMECLEKCGNNYERVGGLCAEKCGNNKDRVGHDCRDKCKDGYLRADTGECIECEFHSAQK